MERLKILILAIILTQALALTGGGPFPNPTIHAAEDDNRSREELENELEELERQIEEQRGQVETYQTQGKTLKNEIKKFLQKM